MIGEAPEPRRRGWRRALGVGSAIGFFVTAALHATGYPSVTAAAREVSADLGSLMPALWLSFSADLVVVGLILLCAAWRPRSVSALVFACAGILPAAAAGLQIAYLGIIPPTALLLLLAAATWAAAFALRGAGGG